MIGNQNRPAKGRMKPQVQPLTQATILSRTASFLVYVYAISYQDLTDDTTLAVLVQSPGNSCRAAPSTSGTIYVQEPPNVNGATPRAIWQGGALQGYRRPRSLGPACSLHLRGRCYSHKCTETNATTCHAPTYPMHRSCRRDSRGSKYNAIPRRKYYRTVMVSTNVQNTTVQ